MTGRFALYILMSILMAGCGQVVRISNLNMASAYQPEKRMVSPEYVISHIDENQSLITVKIYANDLLYVRDAREEFFLARFQLDISLYSSFDKKDHIRSSVLQFTDTLYIDENRLIEKEVSIPMSLGEKYQLYIEFEDLNRRVTEDVLLDTDKTSLFSEGFFTAQSSDNRKNLRTPFLMPAGEEILLQHKQSRDFTLEVNHYHIAFDEFPSAPYVINPENEEDDLSLQADTTFLLAFTSGEAIVSLPQNGIYRFCEPGNREQGFSVKSFWNGFPLMPEGEEMLYPLRYITSADEFNALFALGDAQLAADRFWTKSAGNPDRAQTVMSRYNERVVQANRLFSSHIPGWQTDRGMIYIVFGPPDMVYRSQWEENWYYRESLNIPSAEFIFRKADYFFSDNHFELERESTYRGNWNRAVDQWRR